MLRLFQTEYPSEPFVGFILSKITTNEELFCDHLYGGRIQLIQYYHWAVIGFI